MAKFDPLIFGWFELRFLDWITFRQIQTDKVEWCNFGNVTSDGTDNVSAMWPTYARLYAIQEWVKSFSSDGLILLTMTRLVVSTELLDAVSRIISQTVSESKGEYITQSMNNWLNGILLCLTKQQSRLKIFPVCDFCERGDFVVGGS